MAKKQFKAESKRLLDLMINSIYTHKEIFLREIISNASDAIDKMCYLALTDETVGMNRSDFAIDVKVDKENRLLTVTDNGVGMSKEDLESNLGTIAKSGSFQFKQDLDKSEDASKEEADIDIDIIGQFGVGFYSAFMVSSEVTVISRAYGAEEAYQWQSTGADGYTLAPCGRDGVGTDIIMKIKEDTEEEKYGRFLEEYTLSALVKKYSDYIRYPIRMDRERQRPKEGGEEGETESYVENETLNSMVPIWQRNKSELTEEDYHSFYQEKFFDYEKPLQYLHVDAEGVVSYKALLFIPAKASYDYYTKEYQKGLQLYSSGVLIMDRCADLLPEHYRFVRGIVDSPDLSLNISREMLQHDQQLKKIASNIEKKIKAALKKMLDQEREKYEKFYQSFGPQLKYGIVSDYGLHKEQLQDLLLFASSGGDKMTTLAEYVSRMQEEQKYIYFAAGESADKAAMLPQAERVREKGYELLYFTHEADEFIAQTLHAFQEKEFRSVNSDDLGLDSEEEKKETEKQAEENKDLLDFIKEHLGDRAEQVRLSQNLSSYPACLTAVGPISFEMEKYFNTVQPESAMKAQRAFELNPSHEIFGKLKDLQQSNADKAKKYIDILYYQSMLMAGLAIDNPGDYSKLVFDLMQ